MRGIFHQDFAPGTWASRIGGRSIAQADRHAMRHMDLALDKVRMGSLALADFGNDGGVEIAVARHGR
jgi:hypothetical protein